MLIAILSEIGGHVSIGILFKKPSEFIRLENQWGGHFLPHRVTSHHVEVSPSGAQGWCSSFSPSTWGRHGAATLQHLPAAGAPRCSCCAEWSGFRFLLLPVWAEWQCLTHPLPQWRGPPSAEGSSSQVLLGAGEGMGLGGEWKGPEGGWGWGTELGFLAETTEQQ